MTELHVQLEETKGIDGADDWRKNLFPKQIIEEQIKSNSLWLGENLPELLAKFAVEHTPRHT